MGAGDFLLSCPSYTAFGVRHAGHPGTPRRRSEGEGEGEALSSFTPHSWTPPLSPSAWARDAAEQYVCVGAVPAALRAVAAPARVEVDPITFAVIGGALFAICEEMDLTLRNTSLSPIINIGKDFSCALFTADAQLVAQACRTDR